VGLILLEVSGKEEEPGAAEPLLVGTRLMTGQGAPCCSGERQGQAGSELRG
jgi:hypothetical protein